MSLVDYVRIARRRWLALSLGVVLGLSAGALWYLTAPKEYEGFAVVAISPITNELFSSTPVNQLVNTSSETAILRSGAVAERAAELAGLTGDIRDLVDELSVSVPLNSLVMEVSFRASNPEEAAAGANAFAQGYLDHRGQSAEDQRQVRLSGLSQQLEELRAELAAAPDDAAERALLEDQIRDVRQQIVDTRALDVTPGDLITVAQPPRYATSPRLLVAGTAGLVLGILLGVAFAAIAHFRDDRIYTVGEAARLLGSDLMGILPPLTGRSRLSSAEGDDLALAVRQLTAEDPGDGPAIWLFLRPDVGQRTAADVVAWWLGISEAVVLLRVEGYAHAAPPTWMAGPSFFSPGVKVVTQPVPLQPSNVAQDGARLLVDTEGVPQLSEALSSLEGVHSIVLCVELGQTRESDMVRAQQAIERMDADGRQVLAVVLRRRPWRQRLVGRFRSGRRVDGANDSASPPPPTMGSRVPAGSSPTLPR